MRECNCLDSEALVYVLRKRKCVCIREEQDDAWITLSMLIQADIHVIGERLKQTQPMRSSIVSLNVCIYWDFTGTVHVNKH